MPLPFKVILFVITKMPIITVPLAALSGIKTEKMAKILIHCATPNSEKTNSTLNSRSFSLRPNWRQSAVLVPEACKAHNAVCNFRRGFRCEKIPLKKHAFLRFNSKEPAANGAHCQ